MVVEKAASFGSLPDYMADAQCTQDSDYKRIADDMELVVIGIASLQNVEGCK